MNDSQGQGYLECELARNHSGPHSSQWYPFSTVVTEAELTIREVIQYCAVAVAGLGIAAVMVLGVIKLWEMVGFIILS